MTRTAARHTQQHDVEDVMSDDIVTNVDGRALTADDDSTCDSGDVGDTLELFVDDDPVSSWSRR